MANLRTRLPLTLAYRPGQQTGCPRIPLWLVSILAAFIALPAAAAADPMASQQTRAHFEYLSTHGNSNCSREFIEAIPSMPAEARLQGSCCSPMSHHRYVEQRQGLESFRTLEVVPPDPYDIPAPLASKLMSFYELDLSEVERAAYDYASANSDEGGPCCCRCWRWQVYGGLAKHMIREQGYSGEQIATLWDLSDGCGGESHVH